MFFESAEGLRAEDICVYCTSMQSGRHIDFQQHTGDLDCILFYIKNGAATLCFDGTPLFDIQNAVYFPGRSEYSLTFSKNSECVLVAFRLFRFGERLTPPQELALAVPLDAEFERLGATAAYAGANGDIRRKEALFAILAKTAVEFAGQFSSGLSRIARGVAALEAQFLENSAIAEYAALCNLRENRFRLLFTEHFGMSPVEYRNTLRMRYAHALMDRFHCTVAEAARASGFASTSYFCRLHRKMFGASPAGMEDDDDKMDEMV